MPPPAGPHFARLWSGRAVSDLGSAVGAVGLPVLAVVTLHASTLQVTLLAAGSAVAGGLAATPLGAVHNTALTTFRQLSTPDFLLARAATAWSAAIRLARPVFVLAGGLFAARFGVRAGLWLGAGMLVACVLPLPAGEERSSAPLAGTATGPGGAA